MEDVSEIVESLLFFDAEYQSADWNYRKTLERDIATTISSISSTADLDEVKMSLSILPSNSKVKEMLDRESLL